MHEKTKPEMIQHFTVRTNKHIALVHKYGCRIVDLRIRFISNDLLLKRLDQHDLSKFSVAEFEPYVWMTWRKKCLTEKKNNFFVSVEMDKAILAATQHHILNNAHHPEYHSNIKLMDTLDLCEMIADLCAMSEEFKNDPYMWAKEAFVKRWISFSILQKGFILDIIELIWKN